jgi:hypothetical protein
MSDFGKAAKFTIRAIESGGADPRHNGSFEQAAFFDPVRASHVSASVC